MSMTDHIAGGPQPAPVAGPGATAPLGQMPVGNAMILTIGTAAAALVAGRIVFGADKVPPLRIDALSALNIYFSWLLINSTVKLVAYKFHGHKVAQAYLLIA